MERKEMTEKKNGKIAQRKIRDKWNKRKERNVEMETKKIHGGRNNRK